MKYFLLLLLLVPHLSQAKELLNFQEFRMLPHQQKVEIITVYRNFIEELSNSQSELDFEEEVVGSSFWSLFSEAIAAERKNCFFGGWPSIKKVVTVKGIKRSFCTFPTNAKSGHCKKSQMLCQPTIFGKGLCVDASTQAQKNSAFSQCQKKFIQSDKSLSTLAQEISSPGNAAATDELFALVHDICTNGFQAKTGMCAGLKARVKKIKGSALKPAAKEVRIEVQKVEEVEAQKELKEAVKVVTEANAEIEQINQGTAEVVDCEPAPQEAVVEPKPDVFVNHESSEPIDQNKSTPDDYCSGIEEGIERDRYSAHLYNSENSDTTVKVVYQEPDKKQSNSFPGGYVMYANKLGSPSTSTRAGQVEKESIYARRDFSSSFLGRGKESSFEVTDSPVRENYVDGKVHERFVSTDMRITQYAFFPRKVVPSVKVQGDQVTLKMTTGEELVLEAKTGKVVSGVGKEVPSKRRVDNRVDRKGNKNVRTYLENEFSYQGDALYIQSVLHPNLNEKEPGSVVPVRANVNGQLQECKLKSEDIWEVNSGYYLPETDKKHLHSHWKCIKYKFEKDEELYELVKKTCPKFQFPALVK